MANKYFLVLFCLFFAQYFNIAGENELLNMYQHHVNTPSDINEHLPVLRRLASECASVVEIGIREMVSTWGFLQGLSESTQENRVYFGIDLNMPPLDRFNLAKRLCESQRIIFKFSRGNDMYLDIDQTDMLFIDTLHTYCHLTFELEKFSPKVNKYIVMHDTSAPWGYQDENIYHGNYSEYPAHFDRTKRGLWPAVEDFLKRHPEWHLLERRLNNHGLTTLVRVSQ